MTDDGRGAEAPYTDTGVGLATGAVARLMGVAPTTLRSWDQRYGIGPAHREGHRHRRWGPADIAVLEEMCRLTSGGVPPAEAARAARSGAHSGARPDIRLDARPALPGRTDVPGSPGRQECRGLARASKRLDAPTLDELLASTLATRGLHSAWDAVMMPALRAVGRKWQTYGERYVEVEHLLSWHISSALRRVPLRRAERHAPPVVLAGVPGELHTLPLEALAAGLGQRAVPVLMFGGAVPVEALMDAVRRAGPAAVLLWSQSRATVNQPLARQVSSLVWGVRGARGRALVVTAGPGWAGRRVSGTASPKSLGEALTVLQDAAGEARRAP
ncbi:MerR family transcriptional regulator [Streptomyces sp. NPDC048172]|uniref:MerR family transcriptional regulator n=1 Tax=Streptomyces sp. NPDC048172 TaxID=3365505 RepID=UPI0037152CEA